MNLRSIALVFSVLAAACGAPSPAAATAHTASDAPLVDASGTSSRFSERVGAAEVTVVLFLAPDCPVQKAHEARLRALVDAYRRRGVAFLGVLSEVDADVVRESAEASRRGLAIPIVADRGAALADAMSVEFSTHTAVVRRDGTVLYSGAFDSDRTHLADDATPYVRLALDAALDGKSPPPGKHEPLGCPLRKH